MFFQKIIDIFEVLYYNISKYNKIGVLCPFDVVVFLNG